MKMRTRFGWMLACALACASAQDLPYWLVNRLAGPGEPSGPQPGLRVYLRNPRGLAADAQGNLYLADAGSHAIRRLSADGIVTTVAGSGIPGFTGDGGLAIQASLQGPEDVALDAEGNLWIADTGNARIRRVDSQGVIQTIVSPDTAPNRIRRPAALAFHTNGDLLWSDPFLRIVVRRERSGAVKIVAGSGFPGVSGDGGPAVTANLTTPRGIHVDPQGNLYICDTEANRVRVVGVDGAIRRFAGTGEAASYGDGLLAVQAGLWGPYDITGDATGILYISETGGHKVRRVNRGEEMGSFVGGGLGVGTEGDPAAGSTLHTPTGLAFAAGSMWISDSGNLRVRRVPMAQYTIRTVAGGVPDLWRDGQPALPIPVTVPAVATDRFGLTYLFDSLRATLYRIDLSGRWSRFAGNERPGLPPPGGTSGLSASLPAGVSALTVDENDVVYLSDGLRIWRIENGILSRAAGTGDAADFGDYGLSVDASFRSISALASGPRGVLYAADAVANRVRVMDATRIYPTAAVVRAPSALAVDADSNVYIADASFRIHRLNPRTGDFRVFAGTGAEGCSGDGGPALSAAFGAITSLSLDRDGDLFLYDSACRRIRRIARDGRVDSVAGGGGLLLNDGGLAAALALGGNARLAADPSGAISLAQETVVSRLRPSSAYRCSWQASPLQVLAPPSGGEFALAITASADGCGWTARSSAAWVQILEGGSNWRSGTLRVRITANTGDARSTSLSVAGLSVPVRQSSPAPVGPLFAASGGVVNGASFLPEISPGAWVTLRGTNLAEIAAGRTWRPDEIRDGFLPVELEGVRVWFNNLPAAIYYVSPSQLNVQAPEGLPDGEVTVSVTTPRGTASVRSLMPAVAPGMFIGAREADGSRAYAAAVFAVPDPDGLPAYVGKPQLLPGVRARAARPGDVISVYGTGFGPTDPARPSGRVIEPAALTSRAAASLGGVVCDVLYAGLAAAGLNQVNLRVPDLPTGDHLLVVTVGGKAAQAGVYLPVLR